MYDTGLEAVVCAKLLTLPELARTHPTMSPLCRAETVNTRVSRHLLPYRANLMASDVAVEGSMIQFCLCVVRRPRISAADDTNCHIEGSRISSIGLSPCSESVVNTQRLASAFSLSRDTSNIKQDILRYNISKWTSPLLRRHTSLHSGIRLSPASTLDRTFGILYRNEGFHVALHWRFWSGRSHRRTHQSCESQELDQIYMEFGNTRSGTLLASFLRVIPILNKLYMPVCSCAITKSWWVRTPKRAYAVYEQVPVLPRQRQMHKLPLNDIGIRSVLSNEHRQGTFGRQQQVTTERSRLSQRHSGPFATSKRRSINDVKRQIAKLLLPRRPHATITLPLIFLLAAHARMDLLNIKIVTNSHCRFDGCMYNDRRISNIATQGDVEKP
ncbi:hypothetical protein KCU61_g2, partial [Aureobasidium melanogenum]